MTTYTLDIRTQPDANLAELTLFDDHGVQQGAHQVKLDEHPLSLWERAFHLGGYARIHVPRAEQQPEALAELGDFLGAQVLGPRIMDILTASFLNRTLLLQLPDAGQDALAAAFARIPYELARRNGKTLDECNLAVRAVAQGRAEAGEIPVTEPLRVLLVFAGAAHSSPLAQRLERERLLDMFRREILPKRLVEVDVLAHGVSREAIINKVKHRGPGGYHILHWSGHGHLNTLEISDVDGKPAWLSGQDLVELLRDAGGYIPQLFFLSACHSGAFIEAKDWASLQRILRGEDSKDAAAPETLQDQGFTGTALALLQAGVPQVAAMRWEVGDAYARRLAKRFYHYLLADNQPVEHALRSARTELAQDKKRAAEHPPIDRATPLLFGNAAVSFRAPLRRSPQLDRWQPRPQPLLRDNKEFEPPFGFVGRRRELDTLARDWGTPLTVIQGLAGLGKTTLAAEIIHLFHACFDWVLVFQSKPYALGADAFFRELDLRLARISQVYQRLCAEQPYRKLYQPDLQGADRFQTMTENLVEYLRSEEKLLLVLDNFETHLKRHPEADGLHCEDAEWERILSALAEMSDAPSRVILTTRHMPAVVKNRAGVLWLPLAALEAPEAQLLVHTLDTLRTLWFGAEEDRQQVRRVLAVSRGHPFILRRLADLAVDPARLDSALTALETELKRLPEVFETPGFAPARERNPALPSEETAEQAYLQEVAHGAVELLIRRLPPAARGLLAVLTVALEPVSAGILKDLWSEAGNGHAFGELTDALVESGLAQRDGEGAAALYSFHELVREGWAAWAQQHLEEAHDTQTVRIAYGLRYEALFYALLEAKQREQAYEAGRRALTYLARAQAFEQLGGFASDLITSTSDPRLLQAIVAELRGTTDSLPPGETRWSMQTWLADALRRAGHPDQALPWYAQAVEAAQAAGHWKDVGTICQNWANALANTGRPDAAQATYQRSAEASRRAGSPEIYAVGAELEALRIAVMQGQVDSALPDIKTRLAQVRGWWQTAQAGQTPPQAPEREDLARVLVGGLDIAREAYQAREDWPACLATLDESEAVQQARGESSHSLARTRFNRYGPLLELGRLDEARRVLEDCVAEYRAAEDVLREARALSALADVWDESGDPAQAARLAREALGVYERLPYLAERGISHGNLSNYLRKLGEAEAEEEAKAHWVAGMCYSLLVGQQQHVGTMLHNLAIDKKADKNYTLPRLGEVLAKPEFAVLKQTLKERGVTVAEMEQKLAELEQSRAD